MSKLNIDNLKKSITLVLEGSKEKPSKDCASFLTSFLFLFSFLRSSTLLKGMPVFCACSQCTASPSTQTFMRGRGTCGSLMVPKNQQDQVKSAI
eukprot:CAMPEP_0185901498 /NCGR_PEP_ID=MMETSP0196C-20130402/851_1 /TAXON_ID=2932 /ORGANISM="Alexandrium fundyense, Strain CCMP1719" /LENGTH=93 /DNA_ID=CAMNT_0028620157 /DNA_START=45 /DNA_END=323 /DNA_ORIENTATION=+